MKNGMAMILAGLLITPGFVNKANASEDADLNVFLGGGYGVANVDDSSPSSGGNSSSDLLMMRVGVRVADFLSVEMRTGVNPRSGDGLDASNVVAFYAKPEIAVSDRLVLNAVVGYGGVRYERAGGSHTKGSSVSYGIGGQYYIDESLSVTVDFARADEEDTISADTVVVGLSYDFSI